MQINLTLESRNKKTGPIPVSTTSAETCPDACPLKANGCYAELGPLGMFWRKVTDGRFGMNWNQFCHTIASLPRETFWRHNQAGDLPGDADRLDIKALRQLVRANANRRGFTYTHKPLTQKSDRDAIAAANRNGFTINLSGNNLAHADKLADMDIGPVVTILPAEIQGNVKVSTPKGRRVVVCPATYREDVTCQSCQLCQRSERKVIVGFPAHGASKRKASAIASN